MKEKHRSRPKMQSCETRRNGDYRFHIIVFSFNRAMQCESVLRSIFEHVKVRNLTMSVLGHATGEHTKGYALLRQMYEPRGVRFFKQSGRILFFRCVLPHLWMPRNFYHWLKHDYVRKADNFKPLLEKIIADTPADFVSFNTDDNLYYRDENIPSIPLQRILESPLDSSYRVLNGLNQKDYPPSLQHKDEYVLWDYYDRAARNSWGYPFAVDGTYYDRNALLKVIRRVLYHNPVTLESFLVGYVRHNHLFQRGYAPICSSMTGVSLNKVSFIFAGNKRGDVSIEKLNSYFLDGYLLDHEFPQFHNERDFIPENVFIVRGDERIAIRVSKEVAVRS
jgi:hypothetical protein